MEQPPRYEVQEDTTQVCDLHCTIYHLKQNPRAWFEKFNPIMLSRGLTPYEVDPNVIQTSTSVGCIILAIYVDDILVTMSDIASIAFVKAYLHRHLIIQDLGYPKYLMGIEFAYRPRKLVLNQLKYVLDILTYIGLLESKPPALPFNSKPNF